MSILRIHTLICYNRNSCVFFFTRIHPAIFKLFGGSIQVRILIVECRVKTNYVSKRISNEYIQFQTLIGEYIAKTTCNRWICRSFINQV